MDLFQFQTITPSSYFIAISGNYLYALNFNNLINRIDLTTQSVTSPIYIQNIPNPFGVIAHGNYLYVSTFGNHDINCTIEKIDLTTGTYTPSFAILPINCVPFGLAISGNYLYVGNNDNNLIYKIDLTNGNVENWFADSNKYNPIALAINGNYLYIVYGGGGPILQVDLSTTTSHEITLPSDIAAITSVDNYLYCTSKTSTNNIYKIDVTDPLNPIISTITFTSNVLTQVYGITYNKLSGNTYLYIMSGDTGIIYSTLNYSSSCFNYGTKILCLKSDTEEYIQIQDLVKGDLVKTYLHGFKKIEFIGKDILINNFDSNFNCMYKMEKTDDNKLIEDLIITGAHSILVDELNENQEEYIKSIGDRLKIDDKYLLLSCVSPDFKKIETNKLYTYYHFTIEDTDENKQYGIYANGILTESQSKKDFISHKFKLM